MTDKKEMAPGDEYTFVIGQLEKLAIEKKDNDPIVYTVAYGRPSQIDFAGFDLSLVRIKATCLESAILKLNEWTKIHGPGSGWDAFNENASLLESFLDKNYFEYRLDADPVQNAIRMATDMENNSLYIEVSDPDVEFTWL